MAEATQQARSDEERAEALWNKINQQIQKEAGLIYNWLMILVIVNAGLVTALVSIDFTELFKNANNGNQVNIQSMMVALICLSGLVSTGYFHFAISAASDQFKVLRQIYFNHREDFDKYNWPVPFGDENETKSSGGVSGGFTF